MKSFLLALAIFVSFKTYAGGSSAGGAVKICVDPVTQRESIEVLDYYVSRIFPPFQTPDLGPVQWDALEKVETILKRLSNVDKDRARIYEKRVDEFLKNITLVSKQELVKKRDYGYVPMPAHCRIEQVIYQEHTTQGSHYQVYKKLWDRLDSQTKAGLILHEVIYSEALDYGHKNPANVWYINAIISGSNFEKMTSEEFQNELERMGFCDKCAIRPRWMVNEMKLNAAVSENRFTLDLSRWVQHPQDLQMEFEVSGNPGWMTLSGSVLSGFPQRSDKGNFSFKVKVRVPENHTSAEIEISGSVINSEDLCYHP